MEQAIEWKGQAIQGLLRLIRAHDFLDGDQNWIFEWWNIRKKLAKPVQSMILDLKIHLFWRGLGQCKNIVMWCLKLGASNMVNS